MSMCVYAGSGAMVSVCVPLLRLSNRLYPAGEQTRKQSFGNIVYSIVSPK